MDLRTAKTGDVYKVWLDSNYCIIGADPSRKPALIVRATVVSLATAEVMLGWCAADGMCPTGAKSITMYVGSTLFTKGQWVLRTFLVDSCVSGSAAVVIQNDPTCKECGDICRYVSHNFTVNGPYVCGLCKGRTKALTGGA